MSSNIDTELDKILRTKIDVFCNTEQDEKERDWLVGYVKQLIESICEKSNHNYLHSVMKHKAKYSPNITIKEWYGRIYVKPELRGAESLQKKLGGE